MKTATRTTYLRMYRNDARIDQGKDCFYCKCRITRENATLDHVVARAEGGVDDEDNRVASCQHCNVTKGKTSKTSFMNKIKHPSHEDSLQIWLVWSRRRINLAANRFLKRAKAI